MAISCPQGRGMLFQQKLCCHRVFPKFFQSCSKIVSKLSQVVPKFTQSCPKALGAQVLSIYIGITVKAPGKAKNCKGKRANKKVPYLRGFWGGLLKQRSVFFAPADECQKVCFLYLWVRALLGTIWSSVLSPTQEAAEDIDSIWVILRCWGKLSLVEGRFSKWF